MKLKTFGMAVICFLLSQLTFSKDITGTWKTINDKSGFSLADVLITKNNDGTYSGKIVATRSLPGNPANNGLCTACKGRLKDKPVINVEILTNFIASTKNEDEYINGTLFDCLSGNTYKGKIKLSKNGDRLLLRGYLGTSLLGRTQTWIRLN